MQIEKFYQFYLRYTKYEFNDNNITYINAIACNKNTGTLKLLKQVNS